MAEQRAEGGVKSRLGVVIKAGFINCATWHEQSDDWDGHFFPNPMLLLIFDATVLLHCLKDGAKS